MHSIVSTHGPQLEMRMRGRHKAIFSGAPSMQLHALIGQVPWAPAIQTGVVNVRYSWRASTCGSSWAPTSPRHSSPHRAICLVSCGPISDTRIEEVHRYFPLLPIVVKMGSNVKGYLSSGQSLLNSFFLLF